MERNQLRQAVFGLLSEKYAPIKEMGYDNFNQALDVLPHERLEDIRSKLDSALVSMGKSPTDSASFYSQLNLNRTPSPAVTPAVSVRPEAAVSDASRVYSGRRMNGDEFRRLNWMDPTTYPKDVDEGNLEQNIRAQAFSHYTRTAKPIWDRMLSEAGGDEDVAYKNFVTRHPSMRGVDREAFTGNSWQKFYESLRRRGATAPAGQGERRMTGEEYRNLDWKDASTFPRGVSTQNLSRNRQHKAFEEYRQAKASFAAVYNELKNNGVAPVGRGNYGGELIRSATEEFRKRYPLWDGIDPTTLMSDDFRGFLRSYGEAYGGNKDQGSRDGTLEAITRAADESAIGQTIRSIAKHLPLVGDGAALERQVVEDFRSKNPSFTGSTVSEAQKFAADNGVALPDTDAAALHLVQQDDVRRVMDKFDAGVASGSETAAERAIRSRRVVTDPTTNTASIDWNTVTDGRFNSAQDLLANGTEDDIREHKDDLMLSQVILPMYNAKNNGGYNKTLDQVGDIIGGIVTSPEARQQVLDDLFTPTSIGVNFATGFGGKAIEEGFALRSLARAGRVATDAERAAALAWAHRLGGFSTVRKIRRVLNTAAKEAVAAGRTANTALEAAALPSWKTVARAARTAQKAGISFGAGVAEGVAGDAITRAIHGDDQDLQGSLVSGLAAPFFSAGIHAGNAAAEGALALHDRITASKSALAEQVKTDVEKYRSVTEENRAAYKAAAEHFFTEKNGENPILSPRIQARIFGGNRAELESKTVDLEQAAAEIVSSNSRRAGYRLKKLLDDLIKKDGATYPPDAATNLISNIRDAVGLIDAGAEPAGGKAKAKADAVFMRIRDFLAEYGDPGYKDPKTFNALLEEYIREKNVDKGDMNQIQKAASAVNRAMSTASKAAEFRARKSIKKAANNEDFIRDLREGRVESYEQFNKNQLEAEKAAKLEEAKVKLKKRMLKDHAPDDDGNISDALRYDKSIVDEVENWMAIHSDGNLFDREFIQHIYDKTGGNVYTFRQAIKDILTAYSKSEFAGERYHADADAIRSLDNYLTNEQSAKYKRFFAEDGEGTVFGERVKLLRSVLNRAPEEFLKSVGIDDLESFFSDREKVAAFTDKQLKQAESYMENAAHREAFTEFAEAEVRRAIESGEYKPDPKELELSPSEKYVNATSMYRNIFNERMKKLIEMRQPLEEEASAKKTKEPDVPPEVKQERANAAAEAALKASIENIEAYMKEGMHKQAKELLGKIHNYPRKGASPEKQVELRERARTFKEIQDNVIKGAAKAAAEKAKAEAAKAKEASLPAVKNGNGKPVSANDAKKNVADMDGKFNELVFADPEKASTQLEQLAGSDHLNEVYAKDPAARDAYIGGLRAKLESALNPLVTEIVDGVEKGVVFRATPDMLRTKNGGPRSFGRGEAFERIPKLVEHINEMSKIQGRNVRAESVKVLVRSADGGESYRTAIVFHTPEGEKAFGSNQLTFLYKHFNDANKKPGWKTISSDNMNSAALFINSEGERIYINSAENATNSRLATSAMSPEAAEQFRQELAAKRPAGGGSSDVLKNAADVSTISETQLERADKITSDTTGYPELVSGGENLADKTQMDMDEMLAAMEHGNDVQKMQASSIRDGLDIVSDIINGSAVDFDASRIRDVRAAINAITETQLKVGDPASAKIRAALDSIMRSYKESNSKSRAEPVAPTQEPVDDAAANTSVEAQDPGGDGLDYGETPKYPSLMDGEEDFATQTLSLIKKKLDAMQAAGGRSAAKAESVTRGLNHISDIINGYEVEFDPAHAKDVEAAVNAIIENRIDVDAPGVKQAMTDLEAIMKSFRPSNKGPEGNRVNAVPAVSALALLSAVDPATAHTFTSALHSAINMSGVDATTGMFAAAAGGLITFAKNINVFARVPDNVMSPVLGYTLSLSSLLDHTTRRIEHVTKNKVKYSSRAARDAAVREAVGRVRVLSNKVHRFADSVMRDVNDMHQEIFDALDRYGEAKYRMDPEAQLNLRRGAEGRAIDPKYANDLMFMRLVNAYRKVTTKTAHMISEVDGGFRAEIGPDGVSNYVPRILRKIPQEAPVSGMTFSQLANSDHYLSEAARNMYDALSACFSFNGDRVEYDYTEMSKQGARFLTQTPKGVEELKALVNSRSQEALDAGLQHITMDYLSSIQQGRNGTIGMTEPSANGFPIDPSVRHERLYPNLGDKYYEQDPIELISGTILNAATMHHRTREFGKSTKDVTDAIHAALEGQSIDDVGALKKQISNHIESLLLPGGNKFAESTNATVASLRALLLDHNPKAAAFANVLPLTASIPSGPAYTLSYARNMLRTLLKSSAKTYNRITGAYVLPENDGGHTRLHVDSSYRYGNSSKMGNARALSEMASIYQKATQASDYTASRAAGDELMGILRSDSRFEKARHKLEQMYSDKELETMRSLANDSRKAKREELYKTYAGRWSAMRRARVTGLPSKLYRVGAMQNTTEGYRFLSTPIQITSELVYDMLADGGTKMPYLALGLLATGAAALYRSANEEEMAIFSGVASGVGGIARLLPYLAVRHSTSTADERRRARTKTAIASDAMLKAVAAPQNDQSLTLAERAKILGIAGVSATAPWGEQVPAWAVRQQSGGGSATYNILGQVLEGAKVPGGVHIASAANLPGARFMFPTAIPEARNTMNDEVINAKLDDMLKNIRSGNYVQQQIGDALRKTLIPGRGQQE